MCLLNWLKLTTALMLLAVQGCAALQGYEGKELPDEQVANVALKVPTAALIPLFWIPPLNLLTWIAKDWRESSWGREITISGINLTRFNSVNILPGKNLVESKKTLVLSSVNIGPETCSTQSCTCTESKKDNKVVKDCNQRTECTTPTLETAKDQNCQISFTALAGEHFQAYIREDEPILENITHPLMFQADCTWGLPYTYKSTSTRSTTSKC